MDLDELVFHPWVAQGPRNVPAFVGGSGSYLIDADGRRYLDFSSQLVFTNLGHQHPRIVAAIKQQADRLCTLAPAHASDIRGKAAQIDRRGGPGRARARVVHRQVVRRPSNTRCGWPACTTAGRRCSRPTVLTMARRRPRSTSVVTRGAGPMTLARRVLSTSSVPSCTALCSGRKRPRKSASGRWHISSR